MNILMDQFQEDSYKLYQLTHSKFEPQKETANYSDSIFEDFFHFHLSCKKEINIMFSFRYSAKETIVEFEVLNKDSDEYVNIGSLIFRDDNLINNLDEQIVYGYELELIEDLARIRQKYNFNTLQKGAGYGK